jgi:hypothetical protein
VVRKVFKVKSARKVRKEFKVKQAHKALACATQVE